MEESRYSWKQMPEDYNASYYNDKDYRDGKFFTVIDNKTKKEYQYPKIETRKDDYGRVYDQRIIDSDLWNEEFMGWAISTSKDFIEYVGQKWLTPAVLNYIVSHYEFPQIFGYHSYNQLKDTMTQDLWNKAYQRNKEVLAYIPNAYVTSEMVNYLGEVKNPSRYHVGYGKITPEVFKKMYFNSDTKHKLELIKPSPGELVNASEMIYFSAGVDNLISQEIAEDILSIDIRTIWHVPKKFITREAAIKAMETDPFLIAYVPAEYQTPEYQKSAIDKNPENISLIDPSVLTDEMIYYALSKRGSLLGCVPNERRTLEICEYAINSHGGALRNVPVNLKNSQLCFKAVVKDPSAIKYVPVEFLNQEFVSALTTAGVVIPIKNRSYVEKCLEANKKLEGQQLNPEEVESSIPKLDINSDYSNFRLESLSGLLTNVSLKALTEHNISTVGDLLNISDKSSLYNMLLNNPKGTYNEICGAIKLLKCKYMGIDPMINFTDTEDAREDMRDFGKEIGFSTRAVNVLRRAKISPKQLYELMHEPNRESILYNIRNSGNSIVQEIIFKTTIVTDFYDKKKAKEETATEDETIEGLNEELTQIRAEIQRLNARTDEILAKIQEKMLEKSKGGVLK